MNDAEQVAKLLVKAANTFNEQRFLRLAPELQESAVRELHSFGILSIKALAAIVGCTEYRVHEAIKGTEPPKARGKLNPRHIAWLAYALSFHKLSQSTLRELIRDGTSLSTIEDLTCIPRATLNRWRK